MSDIETKIVIGADTGGLQSAMGSAAASVQGAAQAMRSHLAGLGATARQAQTAIGGAMAQIGASVDALGARAARLARSRERDALAELDAEEKVANAIYTRKKTALQQDEQLGRISAQQDIARLDSLLAEKWALEQDYYQKKLAAAAADGREQQKILDQEQLAYQKFLTEKQRLDFTAARASLKEWQSLMRPIQQAFDHTITGMIMGTTTLQRAVASIVQSILAEFVNAGVRMVTNWLASELAMTGATQAGTAARSAAEGEGLAAGLAIKAVTAVKNITTDAAQAFAGVFAFMAPLLGPAAAGPAGAASATVSAAAGSVASAAGGWVVPSDQLAMVHQNEMILPADLSQGLQGMIAGGGSAGPAAVVHVSAIDAQDVKRFFHANGGLLVEALNRAMRNGSALRSA